MHLCLSDPNQPTVGSELYKKLTASQNLHIAMEIIN